MNYLPKEQYVYRVCKIKMSDRAMSDLLYAAIMTQAGLPLSHGIGIYSHDRRTNRYHYVNFKVHIHPEAIKKFEEISGVELTMPIEIKPA